MRAAFEGIAQQGGASVAQFGAHFRVAQKGRVTDDHVGSGPIGHAGGGMGLEQKFRCMES